VKSRIPIRADFPAVAGYLLSSSQKQKTGYYAGFYVAPNLSPILATLEEELRKHGKSLDTVGSISIAYPHKLPGPETYNPATRYAHNLRRDLAELAPQVDWRVASGIYEKKRLDRSEKQSCFYMLAARQEYAYEPALQRQPLRGKEFFITIDDVVEAGTTMASLISFLEQNHGPVLMAVQPHLSKTTYLAQREGTRARLAEAFRKSSGHNAQTCMALFERALSYRGHSVSALTEGECVRVANAVEKILHQETTFRQLLRDLRV